MDKLSERLEAHAKNAASRAHWAEVNGEDKDGFWKTFAADLESAAQLVRRVEEAPMVNVGSYEDHYEMWIDDECRPVISVRASDISVPDALAGQRVRLVREE